MTPALPFRHRQGLTSLIAFVGLVAIYLVTAPGYHTTAIDSYDFAHTITEKPFFAAGMRLFLWITAMQGLHAAVSWIVPDPDPFVIIGVANALQAAGAVVLFQRLLFAHMGVPGPAAWLTAGLFAFSYGTWRYATELEVYAFVMLASLALLNLAFAADRTRPAGRATYLVLVAVFGAVVTLSYQPLGIVAGFAVPVYFLLRLPVRATGLYMAVYGGLIALGLWFIQMLKAPTAPEGAQPVLDTGGTVPSLPGLAETAQAAVAFLQNLLSANWVFAFPPTRGVIEQAYHDRFAQELVAAQNAHWGYLLFLVTLPAAIALLVAAGVLAGRGGLRAPLTAPEISVITWLVIHAAMALLLHPYGFETWLPSLVPALLLIGSRLAGPLAKRGHTPLLAATLAVFVVHNWFAGTAVFALAKDDYNRLRADPVTALAAPGDLLVVGSNWAFERYLNYTTDTPVILLSRDVSTDLASAIEDTLARGGRVFLFDDVMTTAPEPAQALAAAYRDGARRIELGGTGYALAIGAGGG